GPLPVPLAVDYMLQICEGLAEAHLCGIVHRDIKPQNVFVTRRPDGSTCVKLLDFGISKVLHDDVEWSELTATQEIVGTPAYCSPEQIRNPSTIDSRTDIWSLGVVLYAVLSGRKPFEAKGSSAIFAAIIADTPRSLRRERHEVPKDLE